MSVRGKLEVLLDLERLRDSRIVPFLLEVLADRREAAAVRIHILRRLRSGQPVPDYRPAIAEAILRVLDEPIDLRYSAFTSLQQAGATPECTALLRQLSTDEALGRSAQSTLSIWRLA